jgi:hypothetical protein
MIARGFKPVVWVAAVGTAALGCYMLSLRVAAERADLTGLQRRITATRQQIRALETEVGTRGRLAQLEQWNDQVLALAPPSSSQFVQGAQLARFETHDSSPLDSQAMVRTAAADAAPAPPAAPVAQHAVATAPAIAATPPLGQAIVQRTSLTLPPQPAPLHAAPPPAPTHRQAHAAPPRAHAAPVRAASAAPRPPARVRTASASPPARIRTASGAPAATAHPPHRSSLLDARTLRELGSAARAERGGGTSD